SEPKKPSRDLVWPRETTSLAHGAASNRQEIGRFPDWSIGYPKAPQSLRTVQAVRRATSLGWAGRDAAAGVAISALTSKAAIQVAKLLVRSGGLSLGSVVHGELRPVCLRKPT